MATRCQGFNSKCFLLSYLIIVGFLIVLWMNRLPLMHDDQRDIPSEMQNYVESPPRLLPQFSLHIKNKLALTNAWFEDKWTFVYFTHSNCLPICKPSLDALKSLKKAFANSDFQFLAVGIDSEHETADELLLFLESEDYNFTVTTGSETEIDMLAKTFIALFLQTDFTDGSYQIEQEHPLFVVDPKGRVYATFHPPFTELRAQVLALRRFYARSE